MDFEITHKLSKQILLINFSYVQTLTVFQANIHIDLKIKNTKHFNYPIISLNISANIPWKNFIYQRGAKIGCWPKAKMWSGREMQIQNRTHLFCNPIERDF